MLVKLSLCVDVVLSVEESNLLQEEILRGPHSQNPISREVIAEVFKLDRFTYFLEEFNTEHSISHRSETKLVLRGR